MDLPRHKVPKVYELSVNQDLDPRLVEVFGSGSLCLDGQGKAVCAGKAANSGSKGGTAGID